MLWSFNSLKFLFFTKIWFSWIWSFSSDESFLELGYSDFSFIFLKSIFAEFSESSLYFIDGKSLMEIFLSYISFDETRLEYWLSEMGLLVIYISPILFEIGDAWICDSFTAKSDVSARVSSSDFFVLSTLSFSFWLYNAISWAFDDFMENLSEFEFYSKIDFCALLFFMAKRLFL